MIAAVFTAVVAVIGGVSYAWYATEPLAGQQVYVPIPDWLPPAAAITGSLLLLKSKESWWHR